MIESYHEVRDNIIPRPLSEESHTNDHGYPVSCSFCVVKLTEVPPWVFISIQLHLFNNFAVLKLNNWCVNIAVAVVFCEYMECFFSAAVGNEPPWGLWGQDKEHSNAWKKALNQGGSPPRP